MAKIIARTWFNNGRGCIGAVLAENEYGQKAFISSVAGHDQEQDEKSVLEWGSSMTINQAKGFFGDLVDEEKYGEF